MYPEPLKTSALYRLIGEVEDARAEGLRISGTQWVADPA